MIANWPNYFSKISFPPHLQKKEISEQEFNEQRSKGPLQGKAVEEPQGAQGANDAQLASEASGATPPEHPVLSMHEISSRLTRYKGMLKGLVDMQTPQGQIGDLQQERLADLDKGIADLQWQKGRRSLMWNVRSKRKKTPS